MSAPERSTGAASPGSPDSPDSPDWARRAWASLEVLHVVGYFAEEVTEEYVALGLDGRLAYFPARAAAMGAVGPRVTEATFYVFAPWLHDAALPAAWDLTTPEALVAARRRGMARALARTVGSPDASDVSEALELARRLTDHLASSRLGAAGRTLYAAHAQLPWPEDDDLLALWHAATLVREHRGDGHVALLLARGIDPVEATVLDGAWAGKERFLRATRGWTPEELAAAEDRLRSRGWTDGGAGLTDAGRAAREELEQETARISAGPWDELGPADTRRLVELLAPLRRAVLDSGVLPGRLGSLGA
ncbi:MAG: hypothetical protein JWR20_149 [Marmoricola sp.]|nr:hypothetical protein [Marmoricola sp.]